ncbi:MAG: arginine--tRNA ligase [Candidatus Riflebacteria bacterium]|nr:arginine--tRNA ligase [Candidatus Riflebacteria bacterium]
MRDRIVKEISKHVQAYCEEINFSFSPGLIDIQRPPKEEMGDFALASAMRLAKVAKKPPIEIAKILTEKFRANNSIFSKIETVPPGFVNFYLNDSAITEELEKFFGKIGQMVKSDQKPLTVVVDYSAVNIAKQMHVGHIRSTIIGDILARVLEARGEKVIAQNHLGDWGLPIAKVLWKVSPILRDLEKNGKNPSEELPLAKLEGIYREANQACLENKEADDEVHKILIQLQNGDEKLLDDWKMVTRLSMNEIYRVYRLLDVKLTEEHERGESFYRGLLADTVTEISKSGKMVESQGAKCVFLSQFKTKDGSPLPIIVQKSDGGYNYDTFDLAAVRYRLRDLDADRIIYVTDARQSLHFSQLFALTEELGWNQKDGKKIPMEHVAFGSILGEDGKPLKTRSGENVKLADLLQEAIERSYSVVNEKNPELSDEKKREVAKFVGIGAVKYADLSQNRNNDYIFSFDRMLALNGNTAPYLQYAHARVCSIFRKGKIDESLIPSRPNCLAPVERRLSLKILQLPEIVRQVEVELRPHYLCTYLFELASIFANFYDECPILVASSESEKLSRLSLCKQVRDTISFGLGLLGIEAPQEM